MYIILFLCGLCLAISIYLYLYDLKFTKETEEELKRLGERYKQLLDESSNIYEYENTCLSCGTIIPEGRQVCPKCEKKD